MASAPCMPVLSPMFFFFSGLTVLHQCLLALSWIYFLFPLASYITIPITMHFKATAKCLGCVCFHMGCACVPVCACGSQRITSLVLLLVSSSVCLRQGCSLAWHFIKQPRLADQGALGTQLSLPPISPSLGLQVQVMTLAFPKDLKDPTQGLTLVMLLTTGTISLPLINFTNVVTVIVASTVNYFMLLNILHVRK